jgi:hypothetical protein
MITPEESDQYCATEARSISDKQLAANRANSQCSTGPNTVVGKARSSQNARTHGFSTGRVLAQTPEESVYYCGLVLRYIKDLEPMNVLEEQIVCTLADCHFQLDRLHAIEEQALWTLAGRFSYMTSESVPKILNSGMTWDRSKGDRIDEPARYERHWYRKQVRARRDLREEQDRREANERQNLLTQWEELHQRLFDPKKDRLKRPNGFVLSESALYREWSETEREAVRQSLENAAKAAQEEENSSPPLV